MHFKGVCITDWYPNGHTRRFPQGMPLNWELFNQGANDDIGVRVAVDVDTAHGQADQVVCQIQADERSGNLSGIPRLLSGQGTLDAHGVVLSEANLVDEYQHSIAVGLPGLTASGRSRISRLPLNGLWITLLMSSPSWPDGTMCDLELADFDAKLHGEPGIENRRSNLYQYAQQIRGNGLCHW